MIGWKLSSNGIMQKPIVLITVPTFPASELERMFVSLLASIV